MSLKILKHDIWDIWSQGFTVCVLTNGDVRRDGLAVMGAGLAKQAVDRKPNIQKKLATALQQFGNTPHWFPAERMISFPTKHNWRDDSDPKLIRKSCLTLVNMVNFLIPDIRKPMKNIVFLPIPGIGLGRLSRDVVIPILEQEIAECDKIVIVEKP